MILTKSELIASLRSELRILLHLTGKVDAAAVDYRPTPKQRSALEHLRYLSMMAPIMIKYGLAADGAFDRDAWMAASEAAGKRDFDQTLAVLAAQADDGAALLADVPDDLFRSDTTGFDGSRTTRGSYMVNAVLGGLIAYRTQLFLYLKACGREGLGTSNLWRGADAAAG